MVADAFQDLDADTASVPRRVFDRERIWRLDQRSFEDGVAMLAAHEPVPGAVVGIARGGLPTAHLLGRLLGVPVVELTARHNRSDAIYVEATGRVEVVPLDDLVYAVQPGQRLLVADDICGTGSTLKAVLAALRALRPVEVRCTVLCRNAAATLTPDTWLWDTRDWVVFPWDDPVAEPTEPLRLPGRVSVRR